MRGYVCTRCNHVYQEGDEDAYQAHRASLHHDTGPGVALRKLTNAERMREQRRRFIATDPDYMDKERARLARHRAGLPPAPPRTDADRAKDREEQRRYRARRRASDPAFREAEQTRLAALNTRPQTPPAPPSAPEVAAEDTRPLTRVEAIQAEWDAAYARRVRERELRRAERRRA